MGDAMLAAPGGDRSRRSSRTSLAPAWPSSTRGSRSRQR